MNIQPLESVYISEPATSRLQDNVINFTNQLTANPFINGRLIGDIALSVTPKLIEHKLNTTPQGYLIAGQNSSAVIYSTSKDDKFITMVSTIDVIATIWVF